MEKFARRKERSATTFHSSTIKAHLGIGQILRLILISVSSTLMFIALILFITLLRQDMLTITVEISFNGISSLFKLIISIVLRKSENVDSTNEMMAMNAYFNELWTNQSREIIEQNLSGRRRRATVDLFTVALGPLPTSNFDGLTLIPALGSLLTILGNLVLKMFTFSLLALILMTIMACFFYWCKIVGRLIAYILLFPKPTMLTDPNSRCHCILSKAILILSIVHELVWALIVAFFVSATLTIYVGGWYFVQRGEWNNVWLGMFTVEFTRGRGMTQVIVACTCAYISIALNLIDQLVNKLCPRTRFRAEPRQNASAN